MYTVTIKVDVDEKDGKLYYPGFIIMHTYGGKKYGNRINCQEGEQSLSDVCKHINRMLYVSERTLFINMGKGSERLKGGMRK